LGSLQCFDVLAFILQKRLFELFASDKLCEAVFLYICGLKKIYEAAFQINGYDDGVSSSVGRLHHFEKYMVDP
jgi:hypothetical protein